MLSCSPERDSRQLLVQLEQFREFFFRAVPQGRIYDPRPLIFVFDTDKQYAPYKSRTPDGKEVPSVGLSVSGLLLPRIIMLNRDIDQGLTTIQHEYVHTLVRTRMTGNLPAWFNEGLAVVYETFNARGDTVEFGRASGRHVLLLNQTPLMPLDALFAVDYKSSLFNEASQMGIFYAQSWLLLHYALQSRQNTVYNFDNLLRFLDESSRPGATIAGAFARVFGSDYKKLEETLHDYLRSGGYTYITSKVPAKPIKEKITVRPATSEEREIELAGLRSRADKINDATEAAMFLLAEKYPENPRVDEILAEMKMYTADKHIATDYLRKAVGKKSANPMTYIWLLRRYYTESDLPFGYIMPEDMAAEYTNLVDRAIELAPDCMEAYEMLAIIESQKATMRIRKMNDVLKALPDMKEPARTCMAVATVYWRLKRYSESEAAANAILQNPGSSYAMKRQAHDLLRRIARETGKKPPPPLPPAPRTKPPPIQMPSLFPPGKGR